MGGPMRETDDMKSLELEHHEKLETFSGHTEKHGTDTILGRRGEWEATLDEARAANAHEHSLTVRQALKSYPWAVMWALLISFSIIMEGYDTSLINSLYAYPSFARRFGTLDAATDTYQIAASWQSAMSSGPQGGSVVGAILNGYVISRFGYRIAFMIGVFLMTAFVFVSFFGFTVELQAVGQILCG